MGDSGTSIIGVSLSFWEGPLVNIGVSSLPGDILVVASTISASGSSGVVQLPQTCLHYLGKFLIQANCYQLDKLLPW